LLRQWYGSHWEDPFQPFAIPFKGESAIYLVWVGVEIVKAEGVPIGLVAPHHRRDADRQTDDVDKSIDLVSAQIAQDDLAVVGEHRVLVLEMYHQF